MLNLGVPEIALVLFVALIVFGPNRLPEIARSLGKFVRSFQNETNRALGDLKAGFEPATHGIFDEPDEGSQKPGDVATAEMTPFIPAEEMRMARTRTASKPKRSASSRATTSKAKPARGKPDATRATSRAPAKKSAPTRARAGAAKGKRK